MMTWLVNIDGGWYGILVSRRPGAWTTHWRPFALHLGRLYVRLGRWRRKGQDW